MSNEINGLSAEDKVRQAKKSYMKQWRSEHKDLIKQTQERYWLKKFEKMQEIK